MDWFNLHMNKIAGKHISTSHIDRFYRYGLFESTSQPLVQALVYVLERGDAGGVYN